jgi:hypothetical protein
MLLNFVIASLPSCWTFTAAEGGRERFDVALASETDEPSVLCLRFAAARAWAWLTLVPIELVVEPGERKVDGISEEGALAEEKMFGDGGILA